MGLLSWSLGLLDIVGYARQKEENFDEGLGVTEERFEAFADTYISGKLDNLSLADLGLRRSGEPKPSEVAGVVRIPFTFTSPYASEFRESAKNEQQTVVGELVVPAAWVPTSGNTEDSSPAGASDQAGGSDVFLASLEPIVSGHAFALHCPMTGDLGLGNRRRKYANPLAAKHGIGSVVMIAPGYAQRRPAEWKGNYAMPSVYDLGVQGGAIVTEVLTVANGLRALGATGICYAGISFGAGMAASAALKDSKPLANVSLVGSDGPSAPYEEGIMATGVSKSYDAVASAAMNRMGSSAVPEDPPESNPMRVVHHAYAQSDRYIPRWSNESLFKALTKRRGLVSSSRTKLRGGHGWVILKRADVHVALIAKALTELQAAITGDASTDAPPVPAAPSVPMASPPATAV